ncbi:uncharacterized protein [Zea mays]|uniref:uncharacterized protein n=1 Tax=Zea mays TaxID=4577 RepID=UPI0009A95D23|nr:uncharacterized protein LOC103634726 [Zea mays]|eukprot:XP_020398084.1 uncharacterized protein LOC103634726 [Zea mays]
MLSESDDSEFDLDDEFPPSIDGDELSKTEKTKRGGKRSRAGIQLSPSKCKANRVKRVGCWKYFKVVTVASRKELGVMETKAKCKFCHRSYLYHQGGSTTTLNRHLDKCTQYLNKLAQAKKNLAQASSVSSESTFSTGGRILDDYRSSLKPATVQALVCASSWIRGSRSSPILLTGEGDDGDIESVEFPKCVVASN